MIKNVEKYLGFANLILGLFLIFTGNTYGFINLLIAAFLISSAD